MRSLLLLCVAFATLAGCQPAQVSLSVDPGFYPSAVAHDPAYDRFFVASYTSGEIAIVRRDGSRVAVVRAGDAPAPVMQLAYDHKSRQLWAMTQNTVELIEISALPTRRTVVASGGENSHFSDLAADGAQRAYILDLPAREIVEVDAMQRTTRVVARLPKVLQHDAVIPVANASQCASASGREEAALTLLPDRSALVAAAEGRLWRIDRRNGDVAEIRLASPLPYVSQLVPISNDGAVHHVAALRGRVNEVVTLHIASNGRHATIDSGTRARFDTPFHGAFDGYQVNVLLGRLRHHPNFCGDGRPNLPARLASYAPTAAMSNVRLVERFEPNGKPPL
jgi:hypothetical protein